MSSSMPPAARSSAVSPWSTRRRAATREHPERPIRVGVGIHAGETIEMDGGYVGSAVNVAARVCSVAGAGEVAITETVQGLVRTGLPVHFVPRGTPKLKGIDQPIAIYVVRRGPAPSIPAWRRLRARRAAMGAGLVAAAVVVAIVANLGGVVLFAGGSRHQPEARRCLCRADGSGRRSDHGGRHRCCAGVSRSPSLRTSTSCRRCNRRSNSRSTGPDGRSTASSRTASTSS